jgi:hypothetical protein
MNGTGLTSTCNCNFLCDFCLILGPYCFTYIARKLSSKCIKYIAKKYNIIYRNRMKKEMTIFHFSQVWLVTLSFEGGTGLGLFRSQEKRSKFSSLTPFPCRIRAVNDGFLSCNGDCLELRLRLISSEYINRNCPVYVNWKC